MSTAVSPGAEFLALSEAEQRAVAERLLRIEESGWRPFWCPDPTCSGDPHRLVETDDITGEQFHLYVSPDETEGPDGEPVGEVETDGDVVLGRPLLDPAWAHNHARPDQRLPSWLRPWIVALMSGRGSGKTRLGVEFTQLSARKGLDGAIIGRRGTELINTHVAAILEHAHPEFTPEFQASKDLLVWPNGALTFLFSAERPENIRSVNLSYFWMDEFAFMPEVETAWMNARLATRIEKPGNPIHVLMTSTPTSTPFVMRLEDDPEVEVRRVSTYANRKNLSPDFIKMLESEYEGTRMGRQELHGEVLRDVEGALWHDGMYHHVRVADGVEFEQYLESFDDRVLAVDPAGSKGPRSDATGIIGVGGIHTDDAGNAIPTSFTVLGDATIKGSPVEWAAQVFKAARLWKVSRIVAEKNFGGDMVAQVLADYAALHPDEAVDENGEQFVVKVVHAVQSKETRAEATVGRYEQGRVRHLTSPTVFGDLSMLEKEQTMWVPKSRGGRSPSPNRVDALVWAMREVESSVRFATAMATNSSVRALLKRNRRGA